MSAASHSQLRRTVLHRSLHRPNLLMGGERELVMFAMLISGGLAVAALNLFSVIVGLAIYSFSVYALRRMAKVDPHLSTVYRRQLRYGPYYPPRATPFRVD